MAYNPARHHRRSVRLQGYDYGLPGAYFVTICVVEHTTAFGGITVGRMLLSKAGRVVQTIWSELPDHCSRLQTDAFVVMPNHIHGILILSAATSEHGIVGAGFPRPMVYAPHPGASKGAVTAPLPVTLGRAIAWFKYESTKRLNAMRGTPGVRLWQRGYYEHIIRNADSLHRIRRYIADNPARWAFDRENPGAVHREPGNAWEYR